MDHNEIYSPYITHIGSKNMEMCFDELQTSFILKNFLGERLMAAIEPRLDPGQHSTELVDGILDDLISELARDMKGTEFHIQMKMR